MRENTERPEAVEAGTVRLVGTRAPLIMDQVRLLLHDVDLYERMAGAINPYGDGRAAERSVAAIAAMFGVGERLGDFDPPLIRDEELLKEI
jgi:UDP-N-acetylglucosamine 2-epimerase (non-hydrolysing)